MNKILITGSTGFIGSSLTPMLREAGHDVYEVVRYVSGGRYDYYEREKRYFADLRDREAVRVAVIDCQPEVIINLAAQTAVSFSFINPIDVQLTNYVSVVNLAELAREVGVEQFIHASTSEVYGSTQSFPITEETPIKGTSPYAVAKVAAENFLTLLMEIYNFPVTIIRPFNSYGRAKGGIANRHYVVERAICQALEKGRIRLHNPNPVRDFMFRDDHCRGYLLAVGNKQAIGQAINLCTGKAYTIAETANMIASIVKERMGRSIEVSFDQEPDRPQDIQRLHGNYEKAKRILGFEPRYSLLEGLRIAVDEWQEVLGV